MYVIVTRALHFIILVPPAAVNITSTPKKGRAGQKLTLICQSASSNPAALITWINKDKVIQGSDMGLTNTENGGKSSRNKLVIKPTSDDHDTVYGCRATNLVLQEAVHDGITLDILCKSRAQEKRSISCSNKKSHLSLNFLLLVLRRIISLRPLLSVQYYQI